MLALARLACTALFARDLDGALDLIQQAQQITADIPGWITRDWMCTLTLVLTEAGDLAAALT